MAADMAGVVRGNRFLLSTGTDTLEDINFGYGGANDHALVGNWDGRGDNAGVVRPVGNNLRWYLSTNGDGSHDIGFNFGLPGDVPVSGDWDGDGVDEAGVFQNINGTPYFVLDVGANGYQHTDKVIQFGLPGDQPIVGDWNNDGVDEVGVFRRGLFILDVGAEGWQTTDWEFRFGGGADRPVVGDWDGDGRDNIGVVRGGFSDGLLRWFLDTNSYSDTLHPQGNSEIVRVFGREGDRLITGKWEAEFSVIGGIPNVINFGTATEGTVEPSRPFTIRNNGTDTLHLSEVKAPAGFRVENLKASLKRGEQVTLRLVMDTSSPGVKGGNFEFFLDGSHKPIARVRVAGMVEAQPQPHPPQPDPPQPEPEDPGFEITVRFADQFLSAAQQATVRNAAARWSSVITSDLPDVPDIQANGGVIDDLLVDVYVSDIDGSGNTWGWANVTDWRPDINLPYRAVVHIDVSDLNYMEAVGLFDDLMVHEFGHTVGAGIGWQRYGLIEGGGSSDPRFIGPAATAEYNRIFNRTEPGVPVANTGGAETRDKHFREDVLGNEIMTGFINQGHNSLSSITVYSLQDMGYEVDVTAADSYSPNLRGGGIGEPDMKLDVVDAPPTLDVNGDGEFNFSRDGILLLAYSLGARGDQLEASDSFGVLSGGQIESRIESLAEMLDVDGNGDFQFSTDGLLVLAHSLGGEGDQLTNLASDSATHGGTAIAENIEGMKPVRRAATGPAKQVAQRREMSPPIVNVSWGEQFADAASTSTNAQPRAVSATENVRSEPSVSPTITTDSRRGPNAEFAGNSNDRAMAQSLDDVFANGIGNGLDVFDLR